MYSTDECISHISDEIILLFLNSQEDLALLGLVYVSIRGFL